MDRRLGFGRRCVDRTEKLTHRGFWLDGFEGMWIEGQVLVGGVWIEAVWIGLRNSLTVGRIGTEKWKGNSSWVELRLRSGKETHCGFAFCTRRTMGGAMRSALL